MCCLKQLPGFIESFRVEEVCDPSKTPEIAQRGETCGLERDRLGLLEERFRFFKSPLQVKNAGEHHPASHSLET